MLSDAVLGKVTAFVTRETPYGGELLVFRHPNAGVQLPAGTIEPGESPEDAVLREVKEETDLSSVEIVRCLAMITIAEEEIPLQEDEYLPLYTVPRMRYPGETNVPHWRVVCRSERVRVIERQGEYAKVNRYQYKLLDNGEFAVIRCVAGWVETDALTKHMERYLFQLRLTAPAPEVWEKRADLRHIFQLYWVPLNGDPGLVKGQRKWLVSARDQLQNHRTQFARSM